MGVQWRTWPDWADARADLGLCSCVLPFLLVLWCQSSIMVDKTWAWVKVCVCSWRERKKLVIRDGEAWVFMYIRTLCKQQKLWIVKKMWNFIPNLIEDGLPLVSVLPSTQVLFHWIELQQNQVEMFNIYQTISTKLFKYGNKRKFTQNGVAAALAPLLVLTFMYFTVWWVCSPDPSLIADAINIKITHAC